MMAGKRNVMPYLKPKHIIKLVIPARNEELAIGGVVSSVIDKQIWSLAPALAGIVTPGR